MRVDYALYCIMDGSICPPESMIDMASRLIDCGISCMQLRMKNFTAAIMIETSKRLLEITKPRGIPLIMNDHVEVAKKVNADGVHLGQQDMPYPAAREYLGYGKIIGLSIENKAQAQACHHLDVDYFGVGPVYPTDTKPDAAHPIGIPLLREICRLLSKPVIAIGGIHEDNLLPILKTGVAGVAVISAILTSLTPERTARHLARTISKYQRHHAHN